MRRRMCGIMKKAAAVCMAFALTLAMITFSAGTVSAAETDAAATETASAEEDSGRDSNTLFALMAVITGTAVYAALRSWRNRR